MSKRILKRGFQAPKEYRPYEFHHIHIDGDLHYCASHHFVYNEVDEEKKLYNAQPCYYTDNRYVDGSCNYFKDCEIFFSRGHQPKRHKNKWGSVNRNPTQRWMSISLKSCIRKMRKLKGLPKGTIVEFYPDWYYPGVSIDTSYIWVESRENIFKPEYEVNAPSYSKNFIKDDHSAELVNLLRKEGFLVSVFNKEDGEMAIAYGYDKKIGFSSHENAFLGYSAGKDCILFDYYNEFDKWSRCRGINKTRSFEEIIKKLKAPYVKEILCGQNRTENGI